MCSTKMIFTVCLIIQSQTAEASAGGLDASLHSIGTLDDEVLLEASVPWNNNLLMYTCHGIIVRKTDFRTS